MAERRVSVRFSAEIQGFKAAMAEAAAATQRTKKATEETGKAADTSLGKLVQSATQNRDAWEQTGAVFAGVGVATVAGVGMAVKSFADFDKQMSSVKAATHETAGNMDLLRQAAIEAGAETSFSASEAAQGIEELAKAGVSTKDILGGGLNGALSLAAAGALGVGEASEIAASAMTQFKLSGEDIPHIADLLAAGAGKAQGSVQDMGAALNQVGLVAAQTGLTIEETTGGLAAFASAGLTGSDAGTSFKSMLAALTPNSEAAATAMSELGISAYDSQGNFIGLSEFAGQLKGSLSGLSDEQRNATLETIFGSDAVRAASVLYEQGADGVQKWEDAVNDAGYAAETAAIMQDNLAGDIEKLGGSLDTVFLKSGSGANDFLRGLAQGAEDLVDSIGKIPGPVLSTIAGITGVVGVAALGAGAFLNLTPKVLDAVQAFDKLAPAGSRARGALASVSKVAGAAAGFATLGIVLGKVAEADYMSKIDTGMGKVADALADVASNSPDAASALDGLFKDRDGGDLIRTVGDLESAIKRTFSRDAGQQFNDWGESMVNSFTGIKGSSHILADSFDRLDQGLAGLVSGGRTKDAEDAFNQIKDAAEAQGVSVEDLKAKFPEYADALAAASAESKNVAADGEAAAGGIEAAGDAAAGATGPSQEVADALAEIGVSAQGVITDLGLFTTALMEAGLIQMSARDATAAHQAAIDGTKGAVEAATKAIEDQLIAEGMGEEAAKALATEQITLGGALNKAKTDFDLSTEAGRIMNEQFQTVASTGMAEVEAKAKAGVGQPELQKNLGDTFNALKKSGEGMGLTGGAADTLARKIMGIPPKADINTWMSDAAKRMAEQTTGAINGIPKVTNVHINTYKTEFLHTQRSESVTRSDGVSRDGGRKAFAAGGRVRGYADGGRLPSTGPGTGTTDGILGVSSVSGLPTARVDAGEWVINRRSSDKYHGVLAAINAGTYKAFAAGGRVGGVTQSGGAGTVIHNHYHIDAKPGLAYQYAKDIANQTARKTQDMQKAYGD